MTYWAIKYLPTWGRGSGFIDERTISTRRKWAWEKFDVDHATAADTYKKQLRARRLAGTIRAVKIKIVEVEA